MADGLRDKAHRSPPVGLPAACPTGTEGLLAIEPDSPVTQGGRLTFEIGGTVVNALVRSNQPERVSVRFET